MKKLVVCFIISLALGSCSSTQVSNQLDSDDFETRQARVEALKKEIKYSSDFEDAEFELFNVNGFSNSRTSLPGASSWDYKFAIKVSPSDIDNWTTGLIKVKPADNNDAWTKQITSKRKQDWKTQSSPEYFIRKGDDVTLMVYRAEGIIFKRIINN